MRYEDRHGSAWGSVVLLVLCFLFVIGAAYLADEKREADSARRARYPQWEKNTIKRCVCAKEKLLESSGGKGVVCKDGSFIQAFTGCGTIPDKVFYGIPFCDPKRQITVVSVDELL